mmetsp:Transcript_86407/g.175603  ORF Transcript_86407/g.175603 Transcript_86407/m.175603 type:complete len:331 (+) Transcript_86407:272-1264(+)
MGRLVFGPPGVMKPSLVINSAGTTNPKENPLLANDIEKGAIVGGNKDNNQQQQQLTEGASGEGSGSRCLSRCCGHMLVLLLPIAASACSLSFLIALLVYDRSEIQMVTVYGDEDITELARLYFNSIKQDTASMIMSQYEPYGVVIALASMSCILVSLVTVSRNIQIEVYHKRTGSIVFMKFVNYFASILNVLSYAGLMVAVNFKVTQEDPAWAMQAHFIGALVYFGGTAVYAVLHSFLLWNQSQYPPLIKGWFLVLAAVIAGTSLAFGIPIWLGGAVSEEGANPVCEWVALFVTAANIGFYSILFYIDPVDDELLAFFFGPRKRRLRRRR